MLFSINLFETVMVLFMIVTIIDVAVAITSNHRYSIKGSVDGKVSPTVMFVMPLHQKEQVPAYFSFLLLNCLCCVVAAGLVASTIVDLVRSIGPESPSVEWYQSVLFIWFGLTRIKRLINHQYIIDQVRNISKPKRILIDDKFHHVGSIPHLPWLVREVMLSNVAILIIVGIACLFFY